LLHFEEHRHGNFSLKSSANIFRIDNKSPNTPNKNSTKNTLGQPKMGGINLRF
jgi:hypothetical protein